LVPPPSTITGQVNAKEHSGNCKVKSIACKEPIRKVNDNRGCQTI
jgi:hypothetical protein